MEHVKRPEADPEAAYEWALTVSDEAIRQTLLEKLPLKQPDQGR